MHKDYDLIEKYWKACQGIADVFIKKYYSEEADGDWVGGEVGGVIFICDDFWGFDDLVTAIQFKAPKEKLFKWYYESFDRHQEGRSFVNLKTYLKMQ